jgi:molecular chaperone DnaK
VTFDVDSNGVLKVTAKDKATGKEQSIRIEANSGLTEAEIERMKKDAEDHAAEDVKKKEVIETRNLAEQMVYTAEKALKDHADAVPADVKTEIEEKIKAVNEAKSGEDKAAIEAASEALSTSMQKIGEIMSKAAEEATKPEEAKTEDGPTVHDADIASDETK